MTGALYDPGAYGAAWARDYDRIYPAGPHAEEAAVLVADLADRGPVLELAVGTVRLALPISARGLAVTGLDASRAMLDQLRAKPGAEALTLVEGDMVDTRVPGAFRVVLLAFNSLFVLSDQATQVTCMTNAAAHLDDEGMFMVEAFVPDPGRYDRGQRVDGRAIGADEVGADVAQHDPVAQTVDSRLLVLSPAGVRMLPVRIRYAWPAELDAMARLAGLRLVSRWGGWVREPFTAASTRHVSVYARSD